MRKAPEPCLTGQCRSPLACGEWRYCRQRNMDLREYPSDAQQKEWRELAARRCAPPHKQ